MREREQELDPYWQMDKAIGEGKIQGEPYTIRLRAHVQKEGYYDHQELVPITHRTGQRTYYHARAYVLQPEISLTMSVYPTIRDTGAIGEVVASEWAGMRHVEIGTAQAWYYPAPDRLLVLWECLLFHWVRKENPLEDETLSTVWTGFERFLLERLPGAKRIVTPSWEPDVPDQSTFQEFLSQRGYRQFNERAFAKNLVAKP